MASYFTPSPIGSTSSFDPGDTQTQMLEASIEQLIGIPASRPSFFGPFSPTPIIHPQVIDFVEAPILFFELPIEERQKIPGCGINHHAIFDEPVAAEREPILPKVANFQHSSVEDLFDQFDYDPTPSALLGGVQFVGTHFQHNQYRGRRRDPNTRPRFRLPPRTLPASAILSSSFPTQVPRQDLGLLSPLSSSSSSSSGSSSSLENGFHPMFTSSFLQTTPPRRNRYSLRNAPPVGMSRTHYLRSPSPDEQNIIGSEHQATPIQTERGSNLPESPVQGWNNFPGEQQQLGIQNEDEANFSNSDGEWRYDMNF